MLGKLLKYDLKNIFKSQVIYYILVLILSVITRGLIELNNGSYIFNYVCSFIKGFSIGMIIILFVNNIFCCWSRFKNNLYGDEAYLTHTLPTTKNNLYLSKILTSIITLFTSVVIVTIALSIIYYSKENLDAIKGTLELAASTYNSTVVGLVLLISFILFLEILFIQIVGFIGIIIGHKFNNNKTIFSIVSGVIIYSLTQTISLLIVFIIGLFNKDIMSLFTSSNITNINIIKIVSSICLMIYLLYIIIYYFVGNILFNKGVNVD